MRSAGSRADFAIVLAGAVLAASAAAMGADQAGGLEVVTVTASKRGAASTLDVPVAVQAVSAEQLSRQGATEFADFAPQVAGLSYNDLGPGDKKYVIRGITSTGPATVGVYYDEAVITAANAHDGGGRNADIRLVDLERIEVLKGPQGTLYGASSMSGTIRYITRKPVFDVVEGSVHAEVSDTANADLSTVLYGVLNLPVAADTVAVRMVGWNVDNSGFIDAPRIAAGKVDGINDEATRGGRVSIRWQPADSLNIVASATRQSTSTTGSSRYTPAGVQSFGDAAAGYPSIPGGDLVNTDLSLSPWDEDLTVVGLTADYTTSLGTLTATSNYFDRQIDFSYDSSALLFFFGVPIPAITQEPQERRVTSSELRFASSLAGPLNFVAGAFFQRERENHRTAVVKINAFGRPAAPFSPLDSDDALQNPDGNTFFGRVDSTHLKQSAVFGELSYALSEKLTALVGARYFSSDQRTEDETTHPFGGFGSDSPGGTQVNSGSDSKTTLRFNLAYRAAPGHLLYATASQGFRAGGRNSADLPFASDIPPGYGPDSLWNYELGAKSEWFDGRLRTDLAAYRILWSDIQVQAVDATGAFLFTTNAGTARVDGLELELTALLARGLQLNIGGSYQDAILTEDQPVIPNNPNLGVDGDRLPKVPQLQLSGSLTYERTVLGDALLRLYADVSHRGSTNTQFNTSSPFNVPLDAYELFNARVSLERGGWTGTLFARNLFDKRAQVDAISSDQDPLALITVRPRTIGVSLSRSF